eukprot:4327981-Prymnesium_polylepis.2
MGHPLKASLAGVEGERSGGHIYALARALVAVLPVIKTNKNKFGQWRMGSRVRIDHRPHYRGQRQLWVRY